MQKLMLPAFTVTILFIAVAYRPAPPKDKLEWLSLKDAQEKFQKEKKPMLVDLYTDWCGWCKVMDKKTYTNKNVISYLTDKFYAVKIDAETRKAIEFNGKTYNFNSEYKTHDLAIYLTGGQLAYPTTVIIPADGTRPQAIPGYLEPKDLEPILKYFGEDKYGKISFEEYHKSFKAAW